METERIQGKANQDGKMGWINFKTPSGKPVLEAIKVLVCKRTIAITSAFDIGEGKALRKLDIGELLDLVEDESSDKRRALSRVKAVSRKDGIEGFVTVKGNQGTAYVEVSNRHHTVKFATALEARFASGSPELRMLEEGEIFEVTGDVKKESKEGGRRVRGRNLCTGKEGWCMLTDTALSRWTPSYRCVAASILHDGPDISSAASVRKLLVGEKLRALDAPMFDDTNSLVRVRVRTEKDGLVGFTTVRGNTGTPFLEPVVPAASAAAPTQSAQTGEEASH